MSKNNLLGNCFGCLFSCTRCHCSQQLFEEENNALRRPPTPAPDRRMFRKTRAFFRRIRKSFRRQKEESSDPALYSWAGSNICSDSPSQDTLFGIPEITSEIISDFCISDTSSENISECPTKSSSTLAFQSGITLSDQIDMLDAEFSLNNGLLIHAETKAMCCFAINLKNTKMDRGTCVDTKSNANLQNIDAMYIKEFIEENAQALEETSVNEKLNEYMEAVQGSFVDSNNEQEHAENYRQSRIFAENDHYGENYRGSSVDGIIEKNTEDNRGRFVEANNEVNEEDDNRENNIKGNNFYDLNIDTPIEIGANNEGEESRETRRNLMCSESTDLVLTNYQLSDYIFCKVIHYLWKLLKFLLSLIAIVIRGLCHKRKN